MKTVKDLIAQLQGHDPDLPVLVDYGGGEYFEIQRVTLLHGDAEDGEPETTVIIDIEV